MSVIPDSRLMRPDHIAQQIENAYREGQADARMSDRPFTHKGIEADLDESVAKVFADHYRRIGKGV